MEYWLIVLWLFVLGGVVGSFLNVVVYRLPLGIGIVHPPSHCPKCGKRIRWYDNVPILGWIALRGRCRQCRNPISVRYPVVETVTATMFALVAVVELPHLYQIQLYGLYPYHLLLLCTLLCAGLIEYDGNRPPAKLFVPALVVGVVGPWFFSTLRVTLKFVELPNWLDAVGIVGVLALLGLSWWELHSRKSLGLFYSLIGVGLFLGWPGSGIIAAATVVCQLLSWLLGHLLPKMRIPPCLSFGILTLVWILIWARLVSS